MGCGDTAKRQNTGLEAIKVTRALAFLALLTCGRLFAADFPENAGIYLLDSQLNETKIGDVTFKGLGDDKTAVQVTMDHNQFTEHFLSMRPFRCIEGQTEWFCYLIYPYDLRSIISKDDLSDLEYQLLFIRKAPAEFGIDAWNGLYYRLTVESDGSISGTLLEGDLNSLQSPPAEKYARPIDLNEFIEANKTKRLFPTLRIY